MEKLFELLMVISLDAAMLVLVCLTIKGKINRSYARLGALTMGVGFVLGVGARCIDGVNLLLIPDALGAMLSYTAVLMSFPGKKAEEACK